MPKYIITFTMIGSGCPETLFVGFAEDIAKYKEAVVLDCKTYIEGNNLSSEDLVEDESYYTVFDSETKEVVETYNVEEIATTKTIIKINLD